MLKQRLRNNYVYMLSGLRLLWPLQDGTETSVDLIKVYKYWISNETHGNSKHWTTWLVLYLTWFCARRVNLFFFCSAFYKQIYTQFKHNIPFSNFLCLFACIIYYLLLFCILIPTSNSIRLCFFISWIFVYVFCSFFFSHFLFSFFLISHSLLPFFFSLVFLFIPSLSIFFFDFVSKRLFIYAFSVSSLLFYFPLFLSFLFFSFIFLFPFFFLSFLLFSSFFIRPDFSFSYSVILSFIWRSFIYFIRSFIFLFYL